MSPILILFFTLTPIFADEYQSKVILGNNQFAVDIYKEISRSNGDNFVVSPFSAETVLTLALCGARQETRKELEFGLHVPHNVKHTATAFKSLVSRHKEKNLDFHSVNKVYLNSGVSLKKNFEGIAREYFGADVDNINFSQSYQAAATINQWVEENTNNKIHDLISSEKLGFDTRAILVNALYFKANWSSPFKRFKPIKRDFYSFDNTISVDAMVKNDDQITFNYAENQKLRAQFLELPFQNNEASMVFVLPFSKTGLSDLERDIQEVLGPQRFGREYINMTIPKFRFESRTDFKEILQNLGVRKPFSPREADFSGISDSNLVISDVIQKTFIDVHEAGVEAASATYAGLALLSIHSIPEPKQFHVDHPFIFYIKIQDLIVFVGRVVSP